MDPLISVIIPIYNMETYLARCLDSVRNNTYRNLEIICVDDGSKDSSSKILRAYAEKDSRIVPIYKENGGVSSARNAGLDRMTGEYVAFVDPDDFIHPQYVELLYRALRERGAEIAICGFCSVDEIVSVPMEQLTFDLIELQTYSISQVFRQHDLRSYCWGKLIRAGLTSGVRFHEDLRYVEDTVFFSEVCETISSTLVYLPYRLYFYFQREGSLTKAIRPPQHLQAAKHLAQNLFRTGGRDDIYLGQTIRRCLNTRYMATHIFPDRETAQECGRLLKELRKRLRKTTASEGKEKLVLSAMICFPFLYWLYRSIKEPYMWKWERIERKKRLEAKAHRSVE